jgi:hypothetical protein
VRNGLPINTRVGGKKEKKNVPHVIGHVAAAEGDETKNGVHIPLAVAGRKLLGEDGDLERQLLLNIKIGVEQVVQQLAHDALAVALVAHAETQVQRTSSTQTRVGEEPLRVSR